MRQTKNKLIRQRTQHKREKNEKRTEKESNPGLKESQGSFWMPVQHLHSATDMKATLFLTPLHPPFFFLKWPLLPGYFNPVCGAHVRDISPHTAGRITALITGRFSGTLARPRIQALMESWNTLTRVIKLWTILRHFTWVFPFSAALYLCFDSRGNCTFDVTIYFTGNFGSFPVVNCTSGINSN